MPIPKSLIDDAGDAVRSVIRAFHGSPYDFDKFDASKIGTGEGAQAYGHGLYFSEAEPVADWYRKELSGPPEIFIGGEPLPPSAQLSNTPRERALRLLQKSAISYYDNPVQAVREAILDASDQYGGRDVKPIIDSLMRFKSDGVSFGQRPGKTYEVEIEHPEQSLLDWDAPLHSQRAGSDDAIGAIEEKLPRHAQGNLRELVRWGDDATGEVLWSNLSSTLANSTGRRGSAAAAELLRTAGVPGIRYLDEYSRGARAGTRNIVAFPGTEDSIRILRKYGLLAPMAAGASVAPDQQ